MDYFWIKKLNEVEILQNLSEFFFLLSKPKVVYLRPFLSFLYFPISGDEFLCLLDVNM